MARLSTEQLAHLLLLKETLKEMAWELDEFPPSEVNEIASWLIYTRLKVMSCLARYTLDLDLDPPAPPDDDMPF